MTQEQYATIVKCIVKGAPVLADELVTALNETLKVSVETSDKKEGE